MEDSNSTSERPSLKDISITHYKYAVREVQERLKICLAIGQFVDDISDIEQNIGKNLCKVNTEITEVDLILVYVFT